MLDYVQCSSVNNQPKGNMTATKVSDPAQEFAKFWQEKQAVASSVMSELGRLILLVPGKVDKTYRKLAPGSHVVQDAIILDKGGLLKATLINGRLMSGTCLTTAQAIEAFNKAFPDQSFMEAVEEGYRELFN